MEKDKKDIFYSKINGVCFGAEPEIMQEVLCPVRVPIKEIDPKIVKLYGHAHSRAGFTLALEERFASLLTVGRTGKFVSGAADGFSPEEIAKGKILSVDEEKGIAKGEIYTGTAQIADLQSAVQKLSDRDFFEIDPYGIAEKIRKSLIEEQLIKTARKQGYKVRTKSEDPARKTGIHPYDFLLEKDGVRKKVSIKSLWENDRSRVKLAYASSNDYFSRSCKFEDQDIFAVNLAERTGNLEDFVFAKSVSAKESEHGLLCAANYEDCAMQKQPCEEDGKVWFSSLDDVWTV